MEISINLARYRSRIRYESAVTRMLAMIHCQPSCDALRCTRRLPKECAQHKPLRQPTTIQWNIHGYVLHSGDGEVDTGQRLRHLPLWNRSMRSAVSYRHNQYPETDSERPDIPHVFRLTTDHRLYRSYLCGRKTSSLGVAPHSATFSRSELSSTRALRVVGSREPLIKPSFLSPSWKRRSCWRF